MTDLRARQQPLKQRYRDDPASARTTFRVRGDLDLDNVVCRIETGRGPVIAAGLHEMAGGDGSWACSGDLLLEALVGCAGVTFCAVATSMGLDIAGGEIVAEGDLDFAGTLGVIREAPVGFTAIRLNIGIKSSAEDAELRKLCLLTERYCVVAQSLNVRPTVEFHRMA